MANREARALGIIFTLGLLILAACTIIGAPSGGA